MGNDSISELEKELRGAFAHSYKFNNPIIDTVYKCIPALSMPHHFDINYAQEGATTIFIPVSLSSKLYKAIVVLTDLLKDHPKMEGKALSVDKMAQTFCEYLVMQGVINCVDGNFTETKKIASGLMALINADEESYEKIKDIYNNSFMKKGDENE